MLTPISSSLDGSEGLFILIDALLERLEQSPGIDWVGDDPSVELGPLALGVKLAEVEEKFEGIMANFKIVGITSL